MVDATQEKRVVSSEFSHKALLKDHSIWEQNLNGSWAAESESQTLISICHSPGDVGSVKWKVAGEGISTNEGQRQWQFSLTGDHNLRAETQTGIHVKVNMPASLGIGPTDKGDKISQSKSDRQAAYLYQTRSHCVEEKRKKKRAQMAWPTCTLCYTLSQSKPREIDRYTWISATCWYSSNMT